MLELDKIYNMDCLDGLRQLDDNSIDTIITDPPYGLRFMGKKWDYSIPSVDIWGECLRSLKPGGTLLCFAGSRTQHRMAVNVEDAGFILKDCIMWLYGSGFPKATDISKQLDKLEGAKRRVVGTNPKQNTKPRAMNVGGGSRYAIPQYTSPTTSNAKKWNGWKSHGLKPAYEPILVAMKPNEGSYANNALVWGVSGLNIDGGRISLQDEKQPRGSGNPAINTNCYGDYNTKVKSETPSTGRYPANVILDEASVDMLDEQSGIIGSNKTTKRTTPANRAKTYSGFDMCSGEVNAPNTYAGKGGASRFFYCAKASKSERNAGVDGLETKQRDLIRKHGQAGTDNPYNRGAVKITNYHPTVKPLSLMKYLCIITKTPTGGIVLDPFIGSGTTALACRHTDRHFIGFEINEDYYNISLKRLMNVPKRLDSFGTKITT